MNVTRRALFVTSVLAVIGVAPAAAQQSGAQQPTEVQMQRALKVARLEARPAQITMERGASAAISVVAYDSAGKVIDAPIRLTAGREALRVENGKVTGLNAGTFQLIASVVTPAPAAGAAAATRTPVTLAIPVSVTYPAVARVMVRVKSTGRLYPGTTILHVATAEHADGSERPGVAFRWSSSDTTVAQVDRFGYVTARKPGAVMITATSDVGSGGGRYNLLPFPAQTIELTASSDHVRQGDVVTLTAVPRTASGVALTDVPITWAYTYVPDDSIAAPGATGVVMDGKFMGQTPGTYTVIASSGPVTARKTIDVRPRDVVQRVNLAGRGQITHVHTSDLWTFEGMDKRDYAIVGTWGADGYAYMFDITDPGSITKTDSVKVDARTINDVTISPDGRYGVIAREGASNRVNGVVILDLKNPAHPIVASQFSDNLTGGVHNMFATNDYLFALSGGDKYVIIDVKDIYKPKYVSEYNHPDSRIHDVWVHNGIAFSSEWGTGVVVVDVGNGLYGGSITSPKLITSYPTKSGRTHEIFPYVQKSSGKVYLFLGDEIMSRESTGHAWAGTQYALTTPGGVPQTLAGYTHIIDFTDPKNPKNIARYENPEFGTHDIIVENDILYQAYYDGGLRVVDVSGELMGNLATQGREIAVYKPFDPQGYTPNAPMVMNAMPYKGHIFFTDFNSGLWSAKLQPKPKVVF